MRMALKAPGFPMPKIRFKEAASEEEFEQIHALNHRIFAEEIAQHDPHASGFLVDRFHAQNKYFIAVQDDAVIGMISGHGGPDFSVTKRLPDPEVLEELECPLEVRLLAIDRGERSGMVLAGLLWQVYEYAASSGFSHLLISGIMEREPMYRKIGFRPLGPAMPDGAASFIPMVMAVGGQTAEELDRIGLHARYWQRSAESAEKRMRRGRLREPMSLMPGPVNIDARVARAWASAPVSHRSDAFTDQYEEVRLGLNRLVDGMGLEVTLFPGAGTLANDAVAANLKAIFGDAEGLVLSNGEFGERIAKQASKAGLRFLDMRFEWGQPWQVAAVEGALEHRPAWIWAVHLETSTGVLNEVAGLLKLAEAAGSAVALDCVSSLGAAPISDTTGRLLLASGVSGKSLGSYAGLGFVYLNDECRERLRGRELCPSFDLLRMHEMRGPMTTVPSPLLGALATALEIGYGCRDAVDMRFEAYFALGERVRCGLRAAGIDPLAAEDVAAPNISTFVLPDAAFAETCLEAGYQIAHDSQYLKQRGWGQIATMGDVTAARLEGLFEELAQMRAHALLPA
jgi:aspartate aminotransferase-like enzyme/N-acyl-L-homoserine lactone synthetase